MMRIFDEVVPVQVDSFQSRKGFCQAVASRLSFGSMPLDRRMAAPLVHIGWP
jgi:hypothetical protein